MTHSTRIISYVVLALASEACSEQRANLQTFDHRNDSQGVDAHTMDASLADSHLNDALPMDALLADSSAGDALVDALNDGSIAASSAWTLETMFEHETFHSFHTARLARLSADGNLLVVGDDNDSGAPRLTAYTRNGHLWSSGFAITIPEMPPFAHVESLALSADGNRLVAVLEDATSSTLFYSFQREPSGWTAESSVPKPAETAANSIEISGDGSLVALSVSSSDSWGKVIFYERQASAWVRTATLNTPTNSRKFAPSISLARDGSRLAVTNYDRAGSDLSMAQASVQIFERSANSWTLRSEVFRSTQLRTSSTGLSMGLSGDGNKLFVVDSRSNEPRNPDPRGTHRVYAFANNEWSPIWEADAGSSTLGISYDGSVLAVASKEPNTVSSVLTMYRRDGAGYIAENELMIPQASFETQPYLILPNASFDQDGSTLAVGEMRMRTGKVMVYRAR